MPEVVIKITMDVVNIQTLHAIAAGEIRMGMNQFLKIDNRYLVSVDYDNDAELNLVFSAEYLNENGTWVRDTSMSLIDVDVRNARISLVSVSERPTLDEMKLR